jgi:pimeloyl-ACP methyl ester carboxylesterase
VPFYASHDGLRLFYDEVGDGPLLVVLPGGPGTDARYLGDLGGLAAGRRLVRADARAAGRSEVPGDARSVSFVAQAHDVEHLRRHLGRERLDLLAHSAGCLTAQEYAAAYPGRVRRLILVTPVGRAARETDPAELAALQGARRGEPWYQRAADAAAALHAGVLDPDGERLARARMIPFSWHRWTPERRRTEYTAGHANTLPWYRDAFYAEAGTEPYRVERLARAGNGPLVIAGVSDALVGTAPARLAAATYPGSPLEVMTASGHRPWAEEPEQFRRIVERYLGEA